MKFLALIPARYKSSRFPGKPLAKIGGTEMIVRVCKQVEKAGIECAVATDDSRIYDCVVAAGFLAVMTSENCGSGTERVAEAYSKLNSDADVVINIQGDEPFIRPEQIALLKALFEENSCYSERPGCNKSADIATLVKKFPRDGSVEALENPNLVKVVLSDSDCALYFSRNAIPYLRNVDKSKWPSAHQYLTHIGIYGYRAEVLKEIVSIPATELEKAENLEQLRWIQNGYTIKTGLTEFETIGIDTPADLSDAEEYLRTRSFESDMSE